MKQIFQGLLRDEHGQDIAEYAVMLAVILVIVVGTIPGPGAAVRRPLTATARPRGIARPPRGSPINRSMSSCVSETCGDPSHGCILGCF